MSRDEVRAFDRWAIEQLGLPGVVLMENAGRGCVEVIVQRLGGTADKTVAILCGTGNNGGDGYVIARHLADRGASVRLAVAGDPARIRGDARTHLDVWRRLGGAVVSLELGGDIIRQMKELVAGADLLVDAVFGTGLSGPVRDDYQRLIEAVNDSGVDVLAVDIPSGLDCDTGLPLGAAVRASCTVTFVAVKRGFTNPESVPYTGVVRVASIGVEPPSVPPACVRMRPVS